MRIIIDIPEQFESDYKGDMFKDFFSRVLCDIQDGTICGNYEKETAEMFLKAFDESIPVDRIVEQLEEHSYIETVSDLDPYWDVQTKVVTLERAIEIVIGGKSLEMAIQALEKQQEMIEHCDCGCYECPYYNSAVNRGCMNDFIIEQE